MQRYSLTNPSQRSTKGLLDLLRSSLPPVPAPARSVLQSSRFTGDELYDIASDWRARGAEIGDSAAEAVAQALELVAQHRSQTRLTTKIHAMSQAMTQRITDLMQLH